jgi:ribose transport system ATP-binding protein
MVVERQGRGTDGGPLLEMTGITKEFPGVLALNGVNFSLRAGEVHGLVGENGAGKSTLMKILSGADHADSGEICIAGEVVARATPLRMIELGIAVIYQELIQAPHLTVAENIFLGRLPRTRFGLVDWRRLRRDSAVVMERLGFRIDPRARLMHLSVAQRQMVEIAGALSRNARIVVLDEPSSTLGGAELAKLFEVIRRLSGEGVAFVYITHRLREVFTVCDRVTVLRDGAVVGTRDIGAVNSNALIRMMIGRPLADIYPERRRNFGDVVLSIRGLARPGVLHDVDLDVRAGEILGICGLAGSGRTELLRAILGADPARVSSFLLRGRETRLRSPRAAIRRGVALLPEDRKTDGCFLPQSVSFNVTIARLPTLRGGTVLDGRGERETVAALARRLSIRMRDERSRIEELSGGNQQKCMVARTLNARCSILLIDEPTRGVDVGAKREIYQLLARLADDERVAIVMVSSELPEILGISDRIVVMCDGRVSGRFERGQADEEALMQCAVGTRALAA